MLLKKFVLLKILLLVNSFNLLPAYAETPPAQTPATTSSSQPLSPTPPEQLSFVSNEELLQQFQATLQEIETKLLAHLRAVAKQKLLFEQHQEQTPNFTVGGKTESDNKNNELETTTAIEVDTANENESENAKQELAKLQKQLVYQKAETELLEGYHKQINIAQAEITGFIQRLEKTKEYALEIKLRLTDGTLLPKDIPDELSEAAQDGLRQKLLTQQQSLEQRAAQVQPLLTKQVEQLAQTQKVVGEAKANFAHHTQMLKRQKLEQQHLQQIR